jgi:hypothetical protein
MTTTETARGSAYPPSVEDLVPRARELAAEMGELPSRNRLMRELRIGAGKAAAVLAELTSGRPTSAVVTELASVRRPQRPELNAPELDTAELDGGEPAQLAARPAVTDEVTAAAAVAEPATVRTAGVVSDGRGSVRSWPVLLLALPAFVAIWSGWVGLGGLTGFGVVHPLPGIWDSLALNTAITLPVGMETYAAYALRAWLSDRVPARARRFARASAVGALVLGAAGQVAYHLMTAAGIRQAPWWITTVVACLPVAVLGMGAALAHLLHESEHKPTHTESESEFVAGEVSR